MQELKALHLCKGDVIIAPDTSRHKVIDLYINLNLGNGIVEITTDTGLKLHKSGAECHDIYTVEDNRD